MLFFVFLSFSLNYIYSTADLAQRLFNIFGQINSKISKRNNIFVLKF